MNEVSLFFGGIIVSILISLMTMYYLKPAFLRVLEDSCEKGTGSEFWLRYSFIMLLIAPITLQLFFIPGNLAELSSISQIRWMIGLSMSGLMMGLLIVGRSIWKATTVSLENSPNTLYSTEAVK